jgi:flavin reductase (DIM6/NTAB) family NADH-FMN oxidoreductase RutF
MVMKTDEQAAPITPKDLFRGVAGQLATGVALLLVVDEGELHGTTVGSLVVASFVPPMVAVFVGAGSRSHYRLSRAGRFTVSTLDVGEQRIANRFARPGRASGWSNLKDVEILRRDPAPPLLAQAVAWLDCRVDRVLPVGDHVGIFGLVTEMGRRQGGTPLVYYRGHFHRLGPGVAPGRYVNLDPTELASTW